MPHVALPLRHRHLSAGRPLMPRVPGRPGSAPAEILQVDGVDGPAGVAGHADDHEFQVTSSIAPLAGMKKLRRLTLAGDLVADEGLPYLCDLTDLEDLDLYGVKVT